MSTRVIHVRILGIVLTHVHIQNTCPLVHLCHTYYISTSKACLQMFICMALHNPNLVLNFHRYSYNILQSDKQCDAHGTLCSRIGANTRMIVQPCYQRYIMHQFSTELKVSPLTLVPPTWGWQNTVKQKRFTVHISNIHHDLQGVPKKVTYRICWSHGAPAKSL